MISQARLLFLSPAAVVLAVAAGFVPVLVFALAQGGRFAIDGYVWRILVFTLTQAALSTALSLALAIPAARALARRNFTGRGLLLSLLAVPQSLPTIVVVLALVALYGQSGWFSGVISLYGLGGILLAHVFFNAPLALRFCVEALEEVSPENLRLAAQLGFSSRARWQHVEWPALRPLVPRLAALIFLLCAASFVVVLTLGGPAATTLEVAIYQSLRMDFDLSRAVTLALLQALLCLVLVLVAGHLAAPAPAAARLRLHAPVQRRWGLSGLLTTGLVVLLVLPPLAALALAGAQNLAVRPALLKALGNSVIIAAVSGCLTLAIAWPLCLLQARLPRWRSALGAIGLLGLVLPPAVLATGWFIILRSADLGAASSMILISCLNTLMALPFSMSLLAPAMAGQLLPQDRLCSQLGLSGWTRLRLIDGPFLVRPLAQAYLVAFILSFGDLTAVLLLGSQGLVTLPSLITAEMGNFRSASAEGTALLLAVLSLGGTLLANRIGRPS